jgi:hypothetical protein
MKKQIGYGAAMAASCAAVGFNPAGWEWWVVMLTGSIAVEVFNLLPNADVDLPPKKGGDSTSDVIGG